MMVVLPLRSATPVAFPLVSKEIVEYELLSSSVHPVLVAVRTAFNPAGAVYAVLDPDTGTNGHVDPSPAV
jgi:hypothetical protein